MLAHRVLMMRPALYLPAQVRTISFARIALEPARKAAPPPPPPPSKTKKPATPAKKTVAAPAPKAAAKKTVAAAPVTARVRLTDREKAAKAKEREREKAAKEKAREKEKAVKAKEREKEREKRERAREREKEKKEREKERAKLKAGRAKALEKPYPPPPKRPVSGYFLFAHDPNVNRDRGEGVTDDSIKAGEAWKALTEAEREVYNKKSEKARAQWKDDVAKWVSSLNLAELTAARANREPGTRDESALETLPKRPPNAYAMFLADVTGRPDFRSKVEALAQKQSGGDDTKLRKSRIGLFGRTSADMWKSMTEKEKAVYAAKSADAKKQWEKNYGSTLAAQKEAIISAHT